MLPKPRSVNPSGVGMPATKLPVQVAVILVVLGITPVVSSQPGPVDFFTFFGHPYVEQDVVFLLDGSDSQGSPGHFDDNAAEIGVALSQLDSSQSFNVIVFTHLSYPFAPSVVPATPTNVADAMTWLDQFSTTGSTCPGLEAFPDAFAQLAASPTVDDAILLISDGAINCGAGSYHLDLITTANTAGIPIHTLYVPSTSHGGSGSWMQMLAQQNNGSYVDVPTASTTPHYRRGDANGDGNVNGADAIFILEYLFLQGPPSACPDAADADESDSISVADAVHLLGYVFAQGPPPSFPGPSVCGVWSPGPLGMCSQPVCP